MNPVSPCTQPIPVSARRAVIALIFRTIERAKATHHGARLSVLLKLDVEGAEYSLLPHLLVKGALCLVDFLVIAQNMDVNEMERPAR